MSDRERWRIITRDRQRVRHGDLAASAYTSADFVLRYNDESSWLVKGIPYGAAGTEVLDFEHVGTQQGGDQGILLLCDNVVLLSGPIQEVALADGPEGVFVDARGIDDTGVLASRVILPDPTGVDFSTASHDTVGPIAGEGAIRHYVNRHAITNRPIPGLYLDPSYAALGVSVEKSYRFPNLLAACREIAMEAGLRFRVWQTGPGNRMLQIDRPSDLRSRVTLETRRGTLREAVRSERAPAANAIYALGSGELEGRVIAQQSDGGSITHYGRWEMTVDQRQTDDENVLAGKLAQELTENAASVQVTLDPLPADGAEFGVDYRLGDIVSAIVHGYTVIGYVSEVSIRIDGDTVTVTPSITTTAVARSSRSRQRRDGLRIAHLEHNAETRAGGVDGFAELWVGEIADIPANYALYDGSGGVHDFTNRFILGAGGFFAPGATGGIAMVSPGQVRVDTSHVHSMAHTHTYSVDHDHAAFDITTNPTSEFEERQVTAGGFLPADGHTHTATVNVPAHDEADRTTGPSSEANTGSGGSSTLNVTPPLCGAAVIYRVA